MRCHLSWFLDQSLFLFVQVNVLTTITFSLISIFSPVSLTPLGRNTYPVYLVYTSYNSFVLPWYFLLKLFCILYFVFYCKILSLGDYILCILITSVGEGNDNPLQDSCLENCMDRGARRATVHGLQRVGHN